MATDQFLENRLEAILRNRSPEPHAANDGTEGVGNVLGTVAQVGLGDVLDPDMFLDLPAEDQHPDGQEESVNQQSATSQFHAFCRVGFNRKPPSSGAFRRQHGRRLARF